MNPVWHFVNGIPQIGPPVALGPLAVTSTAVTLSTVPLVMSSTPAQSGTIRLGFNQKITARTGADDGDKDLISLGSGNYMFAGVDLAPAGVFDFGSTTNPWRDGYFSRNLIINGANGQAFTHVQQLTELTTIAAAATTDTTIQMPANAVVLAVSVRTTVVIPTATSYTVGDSGSSARFNTANVGVAANSTDAGTKAGAYYNAGALSVRLTMVGGAPAANTGRVRVTIYYYTVTPPTS
jgi:hypothetical protein